MVVFSSNSILLITHQVLGIHISSEEPVHRWFLSVDPLVLRVLPATLSICAAAACDLSGMILLNGSSECARLPLTNHPLAALIAQLSIRVQTVSHTIKFNVITYQLDGYMCSTSSLMPDQAAFHGEATVLPQLIWSLTFF